MLDYSLNIAGSEWMIIIFVAIVLILGTGKLPGAAKKSSQTLIAATMAVSIGLAISVIADSIIGFAVSLILMGFGFSIFFPLTLEIILSKTRKEISGRLIGAYETVFGIGWAIGPIIGGPITQSFGDETPYLIFCVIGIGVTLFAIMSRKKLEPQRIQN